MSRCVRHRIMTTRAIWRRSKHVVLRLELLKGARVARCDRTAHAALGSARLVRHRDAVSVARRRDAMVIVVIVAAIPVAPAAAPAARPEAPAAAADAAARARALARGATPPAEELGATVGHALARLPQVRHAEGEHARDGPPAAERPPCPAAHQVLHAEDAKAGHEDNGSERGEHDEQVPEP